MLRPADTCGPNRFDRELTDIFAVQDDVTTQIVSALALNLSAGDRSNIAAEHTDSPEAFDCFLRGRELWWRHARESNLEAERLLGRAIELAPGFAPAYAFLAAAKVHSYASGWSASLAQGLQEADKAARLAVQLDERYPFALWSLAGSPFGRVGMLRRSKLLKRRFRTIRVSPRDTACSASS